MIVNSAMAKFLESDLVLRAVGFAARAHAGTFRKYHDHVPYVLHPFRVAGLMAEHRFATEKLVATALLHDVLEDCDVTLADLTGEFGHEVARGVYLLTNVSKKCPELNRAERKALDRAHAATLPAELKALKLLDRLDNLRDLPLGEKFAKVYIPESRDLVEVLRDAEPVLADLVLAECNRHERGWPDEH